MVKPFHKTIIFLAVALLGTICIAIGAWWVNQKPHPVPTPVETTNATTQTPETTTSGQVIPPTKTDCTDELDTECWNTYINTEYGFSFKFPKEWLVIRNEISGQYKNFLNLDLDTGMKAIKQDGALKMSLAVRRSLGDNTGNDYYEQAIQNTKDDSFKMTMDNGKIAVFEASSAYDWWVIKIDQNIFDFHYDLDQIINSPNATENNINNNVLVNIRAIFRQMVKTVDYL